MQSNVRILVDAAEAKGLTARQLVNLLGIDHDRLNNGGPAEVIRLALEHGDDPDWIAEVIADAVPYEQEKHPIHVSEAKASPVMVCNWDDALAFMEGEKRLEDVEFKQLELPVASHQEAGS